MIITIDTEKGKIQFSKVIQEITPQDIDLAFIMLDFAQGQVLVADSMRKYKKRKDGGQVYQQEKWEKFLEDYKNSNL